MPIAVDSFKTMQYREVWCRICDRHEHRIDYIIFSRSYGKDYKETDASGLIP